MTVACPACSKSLVVPGTPPRAMPVQVQPIQPANVQPVDHQAAADPFGGNQNPYSSSATTLPPSYTPPPARRKRKNGATASTGALIAMIGVCIILGGFVFTCISIACRDIALIRALSFISPGLGDNRPSFTTLETLKTIVSITIKTGRSISLFGAIVAGIGYAFCIRSSGAQMGLAIAAVAVSIVAAILDFVARVFPWLSPGTFARLPNDAMFRGFGFNRFNTDVIILSIGIEVLTIIPLILIAIYAIIGLSRRSRDNSSAVTTVWLLGGYLGGILVLTILQSALPRSGDAFVYISMALMWVINITLLVGLSFLILTLRELRSR